MTPAFFLILLCFTLASLTVKLTDQRGIQRPSLQCTKGGCSGELCISTSSGEGISPCIWKEEYKCYATATCTVQANGQCGWTMTPELIACLKTAGEAI